ncbi:hypothetical protein TB2_028124 [Malus domestica]
MAAISRTNSLVRPQPTTCRRSFLNARVQSTTFNCLSQVQAQSITPLCSSSLHIAAHGPTRLLLLLDQLWCSNCETLCGSF